MHACLTWFPHCCRDCEVVLALSLLTILQALVGYLQVIIITPKKAYSCIVCTREHVEVQGSVRKEDAF